MHLLPILLAMAALAATPPPAPACEDTAIEQRGALFAALNARAVEAMTLARTGDDPERLRAIVADDAVFTFGAGDVGTVLPAGDIRAFSRAIEADRWRHPVWMPIPMMVEDPCGAQEVEIAFTNARDDRYAVTFAFSAGRIVAATGWHGAEATGSLPPVERR